MMAILLASLSRYKVAAEILAGLALVVFAVFEVHQFLEHERDIGRQEVQARWDAQQRKDEQTARAKEALFAAQIQEANQHASEREQTIRSLAAAAGRSSDGLRDTIATIGGSMSNATADALRQTAHTYGELLEACDGEQRGMAEEAERLNSEKRQLIEAWPNAQEAKPR